MNPSTYHYVFCFRKQYHNNKYQLSYETQIYEELSSLLHNPDAMFPITSLFACVVWILTSLLRMSGLVLSLSQSTCMCFNTFSL